MKAGVQLKLDNLYCNRPFIDTCHILDKRGPFYHSLLLLKFMVYLMVMYLPLTVSITLTPCVSDNILDGVPGTFWKSLPVKVTR